MNTEKEMGRPRYARLDDIRGITLFNMILYHTIWDLVYIFDVDWDWFRTGLAHAWQQLICWTFIALSGYCWSLGTHHRRRGLEVLGAGAVISLVTEIVTPDQRIRFGILTFLGVAMLLMIPMEALLKKVSDRVGFAICLIVFFLLKGINDGYIGFEEYITICKLPEALYHMGDFGNFIGFTERHFFSADYFSLLPWIFLFLAGYFRYRADVRNNALTAMAERKSWGALFNWAGKHSLMIYMLHQPVIYGVLLVLDRL